MIQTSILAALEVIVKSGVRAWLSCCKPRSSTVSHLTDKFIENGFGAMGLCWPQGTQKAHSLCAGFSSS